MTKLDILAFGSHPDDVELGCGGTLLAHISKGKKAGIIDLTRGELGTRGNPMIRQKEAEKAAAILGVKVRENLGFADGFFTNDKAHLVEVIKIIRKYKPGIILANAFTDRHPDHGRAAQLVSDAGFLSGLERVETRSGGKTQSAWRPKAIYHYIQFRTMKPDILVNISDFLNIKMEAIKKHRSQFYDPASDDPQTVLSAPDFLEAIIAQARYFGMQLGVKYAEGFTAGRFIGVKNLFDLI